MVIDCSAVLAVLLGEPDAPVYAAAIENDPDPKISVVSVLEATLVIGARKREAGLAVLERFLREGRIRIVAFDAEQMQQAQKAWREYGEGLHPAGLNLGDCCTYALAKTSGEVLLYNGDDFRRTDLRGF